MMQVRVKIAAMCCLMLTALPLAPMARAQGSAEFQPVARINDSIVTRHEVDQRLLFLDLLRTPGITRESVTEELIDDRLKEQAGRQFGVLATQDEILLGMEEFAARADLSAEEFIAAIGTGGVEEATFRAFVRSGITWRSLVRQRFSGQARVSEDELNRALALAEGQGNVQVLLSEIVLPLTLDTAALSREQASAIGRMTSTAEFERAARELSIAPSAARGGQLSWMPLSRLPAQIAPLFLSLAPGEVSPPVPLPGADAIALFQLRGLRDGRPGTAQNVSLEYMLIRLAPGENAPALAARLRSEIGNNGCTRLYTAFAGSGETRLERVETERSKTAGSVASVIDQMDPGEIAILPGNTTLAMLCARTPILGEELSRDELQQRLFARKLEDLGEGFLEELRANAYITRP